MTVAEFLLQPKNPKTIMAELIEEKLGNYMSKIPMTEFNKAFKK